MKRFSLIAVFLFALTLCANTFGAVDKSERTLVTKTRTDGDFNGTTTTVKIKWYKSNNRCYITITGPISDFTAEEQNAIKSAIEAGASGLDSAVPYTSIDFGTKNGSDRYKFTQDDLKILFGESKDQKGILTSVSTSITVLSFKDANFDSSVVLDANGDVKNDHGYGWYISLMPKLEELTVSKYCDGPGMTQAQYKTIKKLIIPKKGDAETAMASVGKWYNYYTLESVDLNTSIKPSGILDQAFYNCHMLNNVKIMSNNITTIGAEAFRGCWSLSKISLPYGLLTIEHDAFYECFLKNINFPQTLQRIEANAFRKNPYVRTLKIPSTVTYIGSHAFDEMPELDNVYVFGLTTKAEKDAFGTSVVCDEFQYQKNYGSEGFESLVTQSDDDKYISVDHTKWNNGKYSKKEITVTPTINEETGEVTAVTKTETVTDANAMLQPATLHILPLDEARNHYMNPYLLFLRNNEDVQALIESYQYDVENGGGSEPRINNGSFGSKLDELEKKYPKLKTQYANEINAYFKHLYYENKPDLKVVTTTTTTNEETQEEETTETVNDYYTGTRPWINIYESAESETVVKRVPYESSGSQFPSPYNRDTEDETVITSELLQKGYEGFNQFLVVLDDAQSAEPEIIISKWQDSKWYSICLPWPLSRYQVEETFGTTTQVCEFTKVVKDSNGNSTFYFIEDVTEKEGTITTTSGSDVVTNKIYMEAFHPYMIHPSETSAEVKIEGHASERVIFGIEESSAYFFEGSTENNKKSVELVDSTGNSVTTTANAFYFKGKNVVATTANATEKIELNDYFWAYTTTAATTGNFYYNKTNTFDAPKYVAVIRYNGNASSDPIWTTSGNNAKGTSTVFEMDDDYEFVEETTGVKVVVPAKKIVTETRVYNMNGQYVGNSLEGLSKGIYIMNGKKYVVK